MLDLKAETKLKLSAHKFYIDLAQLFLSLTKVIKSLINFFCFFSQVSGTNDLMKPSTKQEVKI